MVATFRARRYSVTISKSVGNAEKSVGLVMYRAMKMIRIESIIEMVMRKSKIAGGSGTMMINKMQSKKATTVKSLDFCNAPKKEKSRFEMFCAVLAICA